ncbi:MAG TPA: hypothetical protein VHZ28_06410 [Terracidiphilus sp.]|jgi:hypothetical protein|nr:hypothetical protein [Terracidiphilus sp.]
MDFLQFFIPQIGGMLVLALLGKMAASKADKDRQAPTVNGRIEFAPNRRSFWGVYGFSAGIVYVLIACAINGFHALADFAVPSISLAFVLFLFMAFPGTILADDDGLEQVYWLRRKRVAWKDVSKLDVIEKTGEVKISSRAGVMIVHARQLPDRTRLLAEIEAHCAKKPSAVQPPHGLAMSGPAA